mgnify:FL=1|jgi:hypothetical protein
MYHLRLIKALSYTGLVSATQKNPDTFTEDKAIADDAVASGYFTLIEDEAEEEQQEAKYHLDKAQLDEMKFDDLKKLAVDMGIDITGIKKKADLVDAIAAVEVEPGEPVDDENEVDYGGDAGSPTMIELQEQ